MMVKYTEFNDRDRLDTHFIIEELIIAGDTPAVARAHVKATLDLIHGRVTTLNDLRALDRGLREEVGSLDDKIHSLEIKLVTELAKQRNILYVVGILIAGATNAQAIIGYIKGLF